MNIAFAGLRHSHIFALYDMVRKHPEFTICGAWEENAEARAGAAEQGMDCCYATLEELLADPAVEAVALGGCFADRGGVAIASLKAGKHVVADKPLCTTLEELDEIERLAKEKRRIVSCMFTMRFSPVINAVRGLVRSGELGEINNIYFGGQHPLQYGRRAAWYYEEGKYGGLLNDIAIHGIDVLEFAFGLHYTQVNAARCWNKYAAADPHFKDCGQFMLTAQNGAGVLGDVSYAIPDGIEFALPYYWEFMVWGTGGMAEFSLGRNANFYKKGRKEPIEVQPVEPAADYLTDFLRVVNGEADAILPMEEVLASTRATLLLQQAADRISGTSAPA